MFGRRTKNAQKRKEKTDAFIAELEKNVSGYKSLLEKTQSEEDPAQKLFDLLSTEKNIFQDLKSIKEKMDEPVIYGKMTHFCSSVGAGFLGVGTGIPIVEAINPEPIVALIPAMASLGIATYGMLTTHGPKNNTTAYLFNKKAVRRKVAELERRLLPSLMRLETTQTLARAEIEKTSSHNPVADIFESPKFNDLIGTFPQMHNAFNDVSKQYFILKKAQSALNEKRESQNDNKLSTPQELNKQKSKGIQLPKKKRGI